MNHLQIDEVGLIESVEIKNTYDNILEKKISSMGK
jgi:hypothetical protein